MYTSLYMKDARDFSQDLEADGKFNGSVFHRYFAPSADIAEIYCRRCPAFSSAKVLQDELNCFTLHWNSHKIRPNRNTDSPGG